MGSRLTPSNLELSVPTLKFFGLDINRGSISVATYIQKQRENFPESNRVRDIRKLIGIFNVARPFCVHLASWLEPLQKQLTKKKEFQ